MPRILTRTLAAGLALALASALAWAAEDLLTVARFSAAAPQAGLPAGWQAWSFERVGRQTRYALARDTGTTALQAVSGGAASGLVRRVRIDPQRHPLLAWRWKVTRLPAGADLTRKKGDDCAARLFVLFAPDSGPRGRLRRQLTRIRGGHGFGNALAYVWAGAAPGRPWLASPYTDRVAVIPVRSERDELGRWTAEERDVHADYRRAFGHAPPAVVAVGLMTDSDDTGSSAAAWYGDIAFRAAP